VRQFTAGSSESTPTAMPLDKQDSAWGHDQQDGVWNLSHRQYAVAQPCVALAPISVYSRSHALCKLVPAIWLLPCRAVGGSCRSDTSPLSTTNLPAASFCISLDVVSRTRDLI